MFGKLFSFKKVPTNNGNNLDENDLDHDNVKVFEIELTNMEGSPSYVLTHQLTIGSEIGNIVVADPSISPRHASFILQQSVVSVIDHSSVNGTIVNGKKITPGKYIILDETDEIMVGDLVLKIKTRLDKVPKTSDSIQESESSLEDVTLDQDSNADEEEPEQVMEESDKTPTPSKFKNLLAKFKRKLSFKKPKPGKAKIEVSVAATYSANALPRVIAVCMDLLLSYAIVIILMPFDDFKDFIAFIPEQIDELLGVRLLDIWNEFTADYEAIREIIKDVFVFLEGVIHLGPLLFIFIGLRLITTLIFGVSISEYLLSMKGGGNGIWARIGGVLRVLVGVITGPLLIFDVPAIVSRKTFKEFITFTQVQLRSKFIAILSTIIFLPVFTGLVLIAPMFEGFEPPSPIVVSEAVEKRVRVKKQPQPQEGEALEAEVPKIVQSSRFLNFELKYSPSEILIVPEIKIKGSGKKLSYKTFSNFYLKDMQRVASIELLKTFNFQQLLGYGMKGNFLLYDKYPEIYGFVYQSENLLSVNPNSDPKAHLAFANEFMTFTKMTLGLGLDNFLEIMETQTPMLKGLIEYRASLLSLFESQSFDEIGFIKIGNSHFMKISFIGQRNPYDLLIPLIKGEGRVYKVEFDRKENLREVSSKLYKYVFDESNWFTPENVEKTEVLNVFQVVDLLGGISDVKKDFNEQKAQQLFAYYFENSAKEVVSQDLSEIELWKKSLGSVLKLVDSLGSVDQNTENPDDPISKLKQNFNLLNNAFENKDLTYFGLSSSQVN